MFVSKQKRDDAVPAVRLDTLRSVPLFRDFDQAELAEVARLVTTRRFAKHQTIFREGDPGHTFYLILSGSVAVVRCMGSIFAQNEL